MKNRRPERDPKREPRRGSSGPRGDRFRARDRGDSPVLLYGWHTVEAALANPQRQFRRLLATENAIHRLAEAGIKLPLAPELVRQETLTGRLGAEAVHQGLLAEAEPLPSPEIDELPAKGIVLVLDQITDPHNVGAILRSAAAFAVEAVVTTARHSPEASGVLAKAASGALEYVPIATVPNLARGLDALKDAGYFVAGLDSEAADTFETVPLRAPLAIVLGAEGKGLRHLTRNTCDVMARLDLPGRIKSLNVSNATVLALHVASTRLAREP